MKPEAIVELAHVSKTYEQYQHPSHRFLHHLPFSSSSGANTYRPKTFQALRSISFSISPGETFAIVGPNGSGKSTLLEIVSGILRPTAGRVVARGRVAAILELGAGFNPEFTGRENVYFNAEILGLSRSEVDAAMPSIIDFAGLGDFFDRPIKEYSSGMYVRLAFSAAIHVNPEILIIDEALAVGDVRFANRCIRKFEQLKARGVAILFVSHDLSLVKRLADRALLLIGGRAVCLGAPADVVNEYVAHVSSVEEDGCVQQSATSLEAPRGDGTSTIQQVTLTDNQGHRVDQVRSGEELHLTVTAKFHRTCDSPVVGFLIRNRLGIDVYGTNTRVEGADLGPFAAGDELVVTFAFPCSLTRQAYTLTVATQHSDGISQDWRDDALALTVIEPRDLAGVANLEAKVSWQKN